MSTAPYRWTVRCLGPDGLAEFSVGVEALPHLLNAVFVYGHLLTAVIFDDTGEDFVESYALMNGQKAAWN